MNAEQLWTAATVISTAANHLFKHSIETPKSLLERLLLLRRQHRFGHDAERVLKDLKQGLPPALFDFEPQAIYSHPEKTSWEKTKNLRA